MQRVLSSNEFEESRICLEILMEDILLDLCFEVSTTLLFPDPSQVHWKAKTGLCQRPFQSTGSDLILNTFLMILRLAQPPPTLVAQQIISCSLCHAQVSGYRYAQHLEKCLNGTKRSAATRRKQNPSPAIETPQAPPFVPTERKRSRYYGSLTVRIKLRNGGWSLSLCCVLSLIL